MVCGEEVSNFPIIDVGVRVFGYVEIFMNSYFIFDNTEIFIEFHCLGNDKVIKLNIVFISLNAKKVRH